MKIKIAVISALLSIGSVSLADDLVSVKVESITNVKGNGAIEACGTAVHKNSVRPLFVTLKHDQSYYTTLTAANDSWCILFKRWTFSGQADVTASTLDGSSRSQVMFAELPQKN